ncbi:MAG: hypothetical protein Q7W44_01885 [Coriobacteriia bacterium]|nr:hypothetical protein [Coriobacteriia bacterium]
MSEPAVSDRAVEWEYRVPLITSRFMLWDFARVIVLSVLIMYVLVALTGLLVEGELVILPPQVFLITTGILVGLLLIVVLLMGNGFSQTFTVDPAGGVRYASGSREQKWNRAAVILGALRGSPTTTGAGLLGVMREKGGWTWRQLHAARYFPRQRVISLRNSWRTVIRLHCTPENYEQVRALVAAGIARGAGQRAAA